MLLRVLFFAVFCGTASAATYYVDFDSGSDSNNGISTATPWKHCPGDPNATGAAGIVLSPGDTVNFKGGVRYRGRIQVTAGGTSMEPPMPRAGPSPARTRRRPTA